ncbi:MAG TPA: copper homeostasis protein CutC [Acidobacteriaceae bacterium]|jgi:copper homeostasis protein
MLAHAPTAPTAPTSALQPALELCVETLANAEIAARGGAHRIEFCGELADGGITPSLGLLEQVVASVAIPVHCMIRPRGGDFCYSAGEFRAMERDIQLVRAAGAAGVVLGVLTRGGTVDVPATRRLVEIARPMRVTFHRAFDVTRDLDAALEDIITAGADIVLTSGGAERITEGIDTVLRLVERAGNRIEVMGGSGVRVQNAAALCEATGVGAIHASLRRRLQQEDAAPHILPDALPAYELREEDVRALAEALRGCARNVSAGNQFE